MNLPLFLDIAIGLIFIYLILSLLASEIQELVATVLQWRAKHLKESIENLLVGDNKKPQEIKRARQLANKLYANPLIENINQDAKGVLTNIFRQATWKSGELYRSITNSEETVFGDGKVTGPSYIPSETFATSLLEVLKIPQMCHKFTEIKLNEFKDKLLIEIKNILSGFNISEVNQDTFERQSIPTGDPGISIVKNFHELENRLNLVCKNFNDKNSTLDITIQRIQERLERYIAIAKDTIPDNKGARDEFQRQMESLIKEFFEGNERNLLLEGMKPDLTEIAKTFERNNIQERKIIEALKKLNDNDYIEIEQLIEDLPKSVNESIFALVHRAQSKVEVVEKDINQLRKEIEVWFDRSMERASGVYKRNAKGVAILIGFLIAIFANADTFYIVNKLSTDRDIRNAITQNAEIVNTNCSNPTTLTATPRQGVTSTTSLTSATTPISQLDCIRTETKAALEEVPVPIGWSTSNLKDQLSIPYELNAIQKNTRKWDVFGWNADTIIKQFYPQYPGDLKSPKSNTDWLIWSLIHVLLPIIIFGLFISWSIRIIWRSQKLTKSMLVGFVLLSFLTTCLVIFTGAKVILGVFFGWLLSAIAISMGAQFWFDLLGKVINVRNTGSKPESSIKNQATAQDQEASTRSGT